MLNLKIFVTEKVTSMINKVVIEINLKNDPKLFIKLYYLLKAGKSLKGCIYHNGVKYKNDIFGRPIRCIELSCLSKISKYIDEDINHLYIKLLKQLPSNTLLYFYWY